MSAEKREIVPIFFASDDNYAPFLIVAVQSIVSQASKAYDYRIHILGDRLSEEYKTMLSAYNKDNFEVDIIDMAERVKEKSGLMHTRAYYSKATYFRVYIANMFPEYQKALYLDCDIVLNADISELYNFDLGENYVGAITCETCNSFQVYTDYTQMYLGFEMPWYFNAGILVLNLKKWREIKMEERFFDILSKVKFEVIQDQDYLNVLSKGHVLFLPRVWNKIPLRVDGITEDNVKLVHYNLAFRPWRYDGILFGDLFWKHAKNTAVFGRLQKMKKNMKQTDVEYDNNWSAHLQKIARQHSHEMEPYWKQVQEGKIVLETF
jgi:lipopolysaccharide biosynthesis glycosyltransferase